MLTDADMFIGYRCVLIHMYTHIYVLLVFNHCTFNFKPGTGPCLYFTPHVYLFKQFHAYSKLTCSMAFVQVENKAMNVKSVYSSH